MNRTKPVDPRLVPPDPRPRVSAEPPAAAAPVAPAPRRSVDATVLDPSALFGGADPTGYSPAAPKAPPAPAHDPDPTRREAPPFKGSIDSTALFGPGDSPPSRKAAGKPNVDSTVLASMSGGPGRAEPVVAPVLPPAPEGARQLQEKTSPVVFWAGLVGAGLLVLVLAIWLGVRETGALPKPSDEPSSPKRADEKVGAQTNEPRPGSTSLAPATVAMQEEEPPSVPSLPSSTDASARFKVGERVRVARAGELPSAEIVGLEGGRYRVRYDDTGLEETVGDARIAGRLPKKR